MKHLCRFLYFSTVLVFEAWLVGAAPKLEFDNVIYDFGKTSMVPNVTGTFTFQNAGDATLEIQKPQPGCGCTVAGVNPSTVQPGGKGELGFTLNIGNHSGQLTKFITVPSNDPSNSNVRLTIQVNVVQTFQVIPPSVSFPMLPIGVTTNASVEVKRIDGKKLGLTRTQAGSDAVKATIQAIDGSTDQVARVLIEMKGTGAPRQFVEMVQIFSTDSDTTPAINIQVGGRIVGDITLKPYDRFIYGIGNFERLPPAKLERALTRDVTITSTSADHQLELKPPTTSVPGLDVELVPIEAGKSYKLIAKFPTIPKESVTGSIKVETNFDKQPIIEVPVSVNVIQR